MSLYRAPSGALVFGAGTVQWSWGFDPNHDGDWPDNPDVNMQQATVNLFADMGVQPATLQAGLVDGIGFHRQNTSFHSRLLLQHLARRYSPSVW